VKTIPRAARLALGATAGLALMLSSTTAATASTWELDDADQRICMHTTDGHWTYFLVQINGSWSKVIQSKLESLPPGFTSNDGLLVGPGSNPTHPGGQAIVQSLVEMKVAPLPVGVYTASLTATDGTETQSAPVTIDVKVRCY
jgi:YD repeat-containing protein